MHNAEPVSPSSPALLTSDLDALVGFRATALRSVLGVWAHPDDEAYLSAGLMRRARLAGVSVTCLTATAGELGTDDPVGWPVARLARHREGELRRALATIGVDDVRVLGLPDGGCAEIADDDGSALIATVLEEVRPDLVVTFGPDGITGHADHVAVGRWVTRAWSRMSRASGVGALVYATTTPRFARRFAGVHERLGVFPAGWPVTTASDDLAFEIRLDPDELDAKRAALAAHGSQTEALAAAMGEEVFRHWWGTESFRTPRPAELAEHTSDCSGPIVRRATAPSVAGLGAPR